ncbi:MAG TPA: hypothetical protein VNB22_16415, partial [Pyrinomonadaceae bacterium]|nr:hypothetical protein [Pyrinomonadaceae bacterium]
MSDNFEKHKGTINEIYRQTKEELWTTEFATLVLLLFAVLFLTIVLNLVFFSFGNLLITFLIYLAEIVAPLGVLYHHQRKIYEIVREKTSAMNAAQPGISEAYDEWRSKVDSPSS